MGLTARKPQGGDDYPIIEAGVHHGICYRYYDLGTQYMQTFETSARKVMLVWELPEQRIEIEGKDKPMAISKEYTLSLHKKANLRADLESWRGKGFTEKELEGFEIDNLLGVNCMVNIIHKPNAEGRNYARIASIMPLMKGYAKKKSENPVAHFSFDDGEIKIPEDMPDWIRDKVKSSDEWEAFMSPNRHQDEQGFDEEPPPIEDNIPF